MTTEMPGSSPAASPSRPWQAWFHVEPLSSCRSGCVLMPNHSHHLNRHQWQLDPWLARIVIRCIVPLDSMLNNSSRRSRVSTIPTITIGGTNGNSIHGCWHGNQPARTVNCCLTVNIKSDLQTDLEGDETIIGFPLLSIIILTSIRTAITWQAARKIQVIQSVYFRWKQARELIVYKMNVL
jgi:hypothetical protein